MALRIWRNLVNSFKLIVDGSVEGMPIENAVIIDGLIQDLKWLINMEIHTKQVLE